MKKLLHQAVTHGFVHVDTINLAISRSLRSRFLCGNLDLIGSDPYASIPYSTVDSLEQKLLTKQIVTESVVLLQNPQQILPFNIRKLKQIAVIGPRHAPNPGTNRETRVRSFPGSVFPGSVFPGFGHSRYRDPEFLFPRL